MNLPYIFLRIDSLKKDTDSLKPFDQRLEDVFWRKYRLEFNYNSNHLEGNTLTYSQTQLLLIFDRVNGDYSFKELEEMKSHDAAMNLIREVSQEQGHTLSERLIKEINQLLLVKPFYKDAITRDGKSVKRLIEPGQYKKYPNSVILENKEVFHYASPEETPLLMGDLLDWVKKEEEKKELHPIQLAALFHYRLVYIHPFDDCNGRTSRLLMNYLLMKNGYAPIVIESRDKKNYLSALNKADAGDIEGFVSYISNVALRWQEIYLRAIKGDVIEEVDDYKKNIELLKRKLKSTDDMIHETLTKEILEKTLERSIIPLLIEIRKQLSIFDEIFITSEVKIHTAFELGWKTIQNEDDIKSHLKTFWDFVKNNTSKAITFSYIHNQLKKSNKLYFRHETLIYFQFNSLDYSINIGSEIVIRKYYHQEINNDEITYILSSVAKNELQRIEKTLGY